MAKVECPTPLKQKHTKVEAYAHLHSLRRKDGAFTANDPAVRRYAF